MLIFLRAACLSVFITGFYLTGFSQTEPGRIKITEKNSKWVYDQKSREKIGRYYKLVNEAEMAIIGFHFEVASNFYKQAFALKYPNGKDLYNAFLVNYYTRDSVLSKQYFEELAYKGMVKEVFADTLRNREFFQYVSKNYDSFYAGGEKSVQATLGKELIDIFKDDQKVRQKAMGDVSEMTEQDYTDMAVMDSMNLIRLKDYIGKHGFPSFEQKGFWDRTAPNSAPLIWHIIWHNRPNPTIIDSQAYEAVLDGKLRPDEWAAIELVRKDKFHMLIPVDTKKEKILSSGEEAAINKVRASIYLESLHDYKRKLSASKRTLFNPDLKLQYPFSFLTDHLIPTIAEQNLGVNMK